jgi:hypothetical protein
MSKTELDELNVRGREWRNRDKPVQEQRVPAEIPAQPDLWAESLPESVGRKKL